MARLSLLYKKIAKSTLTTLVKYRGHDKYAANPLGKIIEMKQHRPIRWKIRPVEPTIRSSPHYLGLVNVEGVDRLYGDYDKGGSRIGWNSNVVFS